MNSRITEGFSLWIAPPIAIRVVGMGGPGLNGTRRRSDWADFLGRFFELLKIRENPLNPRKSAFHLFAYAPKAGSS
jgi:hypothetical protein